jgi:hypothetical protein
MEFFQGVRSLRLKSHLDMYLCVDDRDTVLHGYRHNSRGTVWAMEHVGDEYVDLQSHLSPTDPAATLDVATPSCRVVKGLSSTPNDSAFLWMSSQDGARGCLMLLEGGDAATALGFTSTNYFSLIAA